MILTYLGDIDLNEETLAHYGVKGMKWKYRKGKTVAPGSAYATLYKRNDIEKLVDAAKLVGKKGKSSTSTKAKKEKAAKKESSGKGSSKEKKEKETKSTEGKTLKERIDAIKAKRSVNTNVSLQADRSQLPIARRKAAELEARKRRLKERRLS